MKKTKLFVTGLVIAYILFSPVASGAGTTIPEGSYKAGKFELAGYGTREVTIASPEGRGRTAALSNAGASGRGVYASAFGVVSYPKLEKANEVIDTIGATVNAIAPGSGRFDTWADKMTGYYGVMFGRKYRKNVDLNVSLTYAKGALDNHKTGIINTVIPPYNTVNGQTLRSDFRQEYITRAISVGPKFKKRLANGFEASFAAKAGYILLVSDTYYGLSTPGINSGTRMHFDARKFYAVFALEFDKVWKLRNGKELSAGIIIEHIPSCVMKNDAHGTETVNGVAKYKSLPGENDLSTKKPHIGLIVNYRF